MTSVTKEKDFFISSPIMLVNDNNNKQKTLSIPIRNPDDYYSNNVSKSWSGYSLLEKSKKPTKKYSVSPSDEFNIYC